MEYEYLIEVKFPVLVTEQVAGKSGIVLERLSRLFDHTKISVVLPMYNEEKTIRSVIEKIPKFPNLEIIVVDDASQDDSRDVVRQCPDVILMCHEQNKGYGRTVMDGITRASGDIIITCDADGQHDLRDIGTLITPILDHKADLVIGSRYLGKYAYELPLTSRIGEAFIEIVLKIVFGINIQANQGGFRAFRYSSVGKIYTTGNFPGFAFATETLIRAQLAKLRIKECPIHLYNRQHGRSRVKIISLLISLVNCLWIYAIKRFCGNLLYQKMVKLIKYFRLFLHKNHIAKNRILCKIDRKNICI